ncbi:MAG: hypothetical protein L3J03_12175, partial [Desulfobacterales bacterium]|nr:hypothetical protein [Desulfobacterales bacterium]
LMDSESPLRRSEFLLDSLFMNSRPFSMERPLVEEDPFPDRRGFVVNLLAGKGRCQLCRSRNNLLDGRDSSCNLLILLGGI